VQESDPADRDSLKCNSGDKDDKNHRQREGCYGGLILSRLLPLFLDLESKLVVIFGGGAVGERKAGIFSQGARVVVISQTFTEGLKQMQKDNLASLVEADLGVNFEKYLEGAFIVVPATSDAALNQSIERKASERGILVNRVIGAGDVVVPSIIRREPITIAISTESPALSKYLRMRLEIYLKENFAEMAKLLRQIRKDLKNTVPDQRTRSRIIWDILSDQEIWKLLDESYEKAYMKACEQVFQYERDCLNAGDSPKGVHR
jgi:precorrin-2 dehydrogenase